MTPPNRLSIQQPWVRLWLASALFSAWMLFLLVGWAVGGAIHLLLVAALALFPWRDEAQEKIRKTQESAREVEAPTDRAASDQTANDRAAHDRTVPQTSSSTSQPGGDS